MTHWSLTANVYICSYTDIFTTAPLFGKFHSPLKDAGLTLRRRPLHHLESLCAQRLDPSLPQPNPTDDNSRQRIYTPRLTFLAFLDQTLDSDSSCRSAVDQILFYYQSLPHHSQIDPDTSAYCQARARWTCQELIDIRRALARGPALHGTRSLLASRANAHSRFSTAPASTSPTRPLTANFARNPRTRSPVVVFLWRGWWGFSASKPGRCWRSPLPLTPIPNSGR
jgi:hypothetical protein